MTDLVPKLVKKYEQPNRYQNFGPVLNQIHIDGFRGIENLPVDLSFPVMAFSGLNGAGKSTIGQIAICGYKRPSTFQQSKRYYIKDFFPASILDPSPFKPSARVHFRFQTDTPGHQQEVTLARAKKEWTGYKRQPERNCFYVGFSIYIPKVERKDFSIYRSSNLELRDLRQIPEHVQLRVSKILGHDYDDIGFQNVSTKKKSGELAVASRFGAKYSENNMGFGEGRLLYMVDLLENSPEQSLFVFEEPETSLHGDAQHKFARYLLDVVNRRHHQILISTHSDTILNALPAVARCLIHRDKSGVSSCNLISASRAKTILTGGHHRLPVLVEDEFAKSILNEIIRIGDSGMLRMLKIHPIGSHNAVKEGLKLMGNLGRVAIGFVDGDTAPSNEHSVYSLPGKTAPEREVFSAEPVINYFESEYGKDISTITTQDPDSDHHDYSTAVADVLSLPEDYVRTLAAKIYASEHLEESERSAVVTAIAKTLECN